LDRIFKKASVAHSYGYFNQLDDLRCRPSSHFSAALQWLFIEASSSFLRSLFLHPWWSLSWIAEQKFYCLVSYCSSQLKRLLKLQYQICRSLLCHLRNTCQRRCPRKEQISLVESCWKN